MQIIQNPLLDKATISADRDRTPASTCSEQPTPSSKRRPPAAIQALVAKLGLRYRPSAQADLEAHAGAIALLAQDLADIPADLLDRAIQRHVQTSHYMPKASELITLAQSFVAKPGKRDPYEIAAYGNADLMSKNRHDIHWIVDDGAARLEWK